jgi:DeoR family transcriptional regulator, catabolite repression regulator
LKRINRCERGLHPEDAAVSALTDFLRVCPLSVEAETLIDDAHADMELWGVPAMLVTEQAAGADLKVIGIITRDALERRRAAYSGSSGREKWIGEVMTSCNDLPVIRYETLRSLTVRDLHGLFEGTTSSYLLVIEDNGGSVAARGWVALSVLVADQ